MCGSIFKYPFSIINPKIYFIPAIYIQLLEPVYHVQPPRPARFPCPYTSAAITYGSTLYLLLSSLVRACSIGFIILKFSYALSFKFSMVWAIIVQVAAWVYCPPFSLVPGKYAFIYPGSNLLFSNGGSNNFIIPISLSTKWFSRLSIAIYFLSLLPAPEIVAQLCDMLSILHSSFCKLPSASPSSVKALLYHLPSQALLFNALFSSSIINWYFSFFSKFPILSQIGINSFNTAYMKKPSHTLSPFPFAPTLLIPSFQSPVPILGRPCSPKFPIPVWFNPSFPRLSVSPLFCSASCSYFPTFIFSTSLSSIPIAFSIALMQCLYTLSLKSASLYKSYLSFSFSDNCSPSLYDGFSSKIS